MTKYFLQDHLGSTVAMTNSSGAATEQTSYDSFGNRTASLSTRYQYTGREYDAFSGFHYYRARWYDANLGRFVSEDPIGFGGGDVNLYGYVWNSPLHFSDPMGLDGWGNDSADWADSNINNAVVFIRLIRNIGFGTEQSIPLGICLRWLRIR
ncbi:MAG: RHS repeat-associated core domain-containing protein [Pyrinomonadaceae bacterium]